MLFTTGKNIGLIHHIAKKAIKGLIKKILGISRYEKPNVTDIESNKIYVHLEVEKNNIIKQTSFIRNF